jgi:hypothetical protein
VSKEKLDKDDWGNWQPVVLERRGIPYYGELEELKRQHIRIRVVRYKGEEGKEWLRVYRHI